MNKKKYVVARNRQELDAVLKLSPALIAERDFRESINNKIISVCKKSGLTHAEIAKTAKTSRPRITNILNGVAMTSPPT